jgi:predicted DNA-binding antitoxin AbrB/MazE fold protein
LGFEFAQGALTFISTSRRFREYAILSLSRWTASRRASQSLRQNRPLGAPAERARLLPRPFPLPLANRYTYVVTNTTTIDVDAVYENGVLRLKEPVDLPENAEVHVTIQAGTEAQTPLGRRLRELRSEIMKSGVTPLGWDEIQEEVTLRRGGWRERP